ncbi:MAG: T9SS type A sorting domain-containing protein [Carboxylicivirga sp.]|jgi:hypothetical protein|nr:T9SS type A sorting domain-containing protein [Carboxylicivirga sp.]
MKHVITAFLMLFIKLSVFAQITLEKEYINGGMQGIPSAFIANDKLYYFEIDNNYNTNSCSFLLYDENHQLIKSSLIQISGIESIAEVYLPSDNLFNKDGLIEFIACYQSTSSGDGTLMAIINEDGQKIYDLGHYNKATYIKTPNNKFKLLVHYQSDAKGMKVYNLPGILTSIQEESLKNISSIAFPNPASDFINITLNGKTINSKKIEVFNGKGHFIDSKPIDVGANSITLNTSAYAKGLYIYKIGNQQGKFVIK